MTVESIEPTPHTTTKAPELLIDNNDTTHDDLETIVGRYVAGAETVFEGFVPVGEVQGSFEHIREGLDEDIIGQSAAKDAVLRVLEASQARIMGDRTPIANLAFLGPTGVGKSELARSLARRLNPDGDGNIITIDCSDYSNGHEVTKLTGSPPSFVGGDIKPRLSKDAVEKPGTTVVLFDEIEKGSPELYRLMLQIMGDGKLSLSNNTEVNFQNTIVIMTSNLGSTEMAKALSEKSTGFSPVKRAVGDRTVDSIATAQFEKFFDKEFIGRLNAEVVFNPLNRDDLGQVLDLKLSQANQGYIDQYGVCVSLSAKAREYILDIAAERPDLGARPIANALKHEVLPTVGRYIGAGHLANGTHIRAFHKDEVATETSKDDAALVFMHKADETIARKPRPREIDHLTSTSMVFQDGSIHQSSPSILGMLKDFYAKQPQANDGFTHNYSTNK